MEISTDMFYYSDKEFSQEISTLGIKNLPDVLFLKNPKTDNIACFEKIRNIISCEELSGWEFFNKTYGLTLTIFND